LLVPGEALPRKWRAAADGVSAALGLNVWISLVLVPGVFVGAFRQSGTAVALAAIPPVILGVSVAFRSQVGLLFGFPVTLLFPIAFEPRLVTANVHGPVTFVLVAVGTVAYLFGVCFLSAFRDPPPPERQKRLGAAGPPAPRWRRRFRMYLAFAILSAVFPAALLYAVNFSPTNQAFLRDLYPGRFAAMQTVLNLGVLALWLGLYGSHFLGLMKLHRTGDRPLLGELERLRLETRRATPRPAFYAAVVCALGFMLLLVLMRYR
jgi:hypothetical protein